MALVLKPKVGTANTSTEQKHNGQTVSQAESQEEVPLQPDLIVDQPGPFCRIAVEASLTINLGDFNSTRIQVSLDVPSLPGELDETFEFAREWVNGKMELMATEVQQSQG